jgi:hypothetical protein
VRGAGLAVARRAIRAQHDPPRPGQIG